MADETTPRVKAGIYTRKGDKGETLLGGRQRVPKSHYRVEALGVVDELSATIGMIATTCLYTKDIPFYHSLQADLFTIGAILGGCDDIEIDQERIAFLEEKIDTISADLAPLRNFILPGGDAGAPRAMEAAWCHMARTACRRAERAVVHVHECDNDIPPNVLVYLNRLSDLLFVQARKVNGNGERDVLWSKDPPLQSR